MCIHSCAQYTFGFPCLNGTVQAEPCPYPYSILTCWKTSCPSLPGIASSCSSPPRNTSRARWISSQGPTLVKLRLVTGTAHPKGNSCQVEIRIYICLQPLFRKQLGLIYLNRHALCDGLERVQTGIDLSDDQNTESLCQSPPRRLRIPGLARRNQSSGFCASGAHTRQRRGDLSRKPWGTLRLHPGIPQSMAGPWNRSRKPRDPNRPDGGTAACAQKPPRSPAWQRETRPPYYSGYIVGGHGRDPGAR